jgi:hypothetical protein
MIGIPLIFMLFSIANMCFGMLTLHTLQEAVEQGARYVATRGSTCSSGTNTCSATVQQIANIVATNAAGIAGQNLNITLIPASGSANQISCSPVTNCLSSCSAGCSGNRTSVWPSSSNSDNSPGKDFIITADCTITAPIFMFWTGTSSEKQSSASTFHAYSRQRLMF